MGRQRSNEKVWCCIYFLCHFLLVGFGNGSVYYRVHGLWVSGHEGGALSISGIKRGCEKLMYCIIYP